MVLTWKQTHRSVEQIGDPRNPHLYGKLIYNKWGSHIQWVKKDSSINGDGKIRQLPAKESDSPTFSHRTQK